jgi:predicted nucleic acid-binding protein
MKLVIDANIVISCLISGGISEIVFSPKLELYAPELLFTEMRKHKQEIISKSSLLEEDIDLLLLLIEKQVTIVSKIEFLSEILQAEAVLREHKKDIPYVALALHLKCPIWSYEKRLDNIKGIEIFTTQEIINLIK